MTCVAMTRMQLKYDDTGYKISTYRGGGGWINYVNLNNIPIARKASRTNIHVITRFNIDIHEIENRKCERFIRSFISTRTFVLA